MPGRKTVYSEKVVEYIRESIREERLLPGQKVCEESIASAVNVSRAPVREALNVLLGEGMLLSGPHLGKRVAALSMQRIYDYYMLAGSMYGLMLSATMDDFTRADLDELEVMVSQFHAMATQSEYSFEAYDRELLHLHTFLLRYASFRWNLRTLKFCHAISEVLYYRSHRKLLAPADYLLFSSGALSALKRKDSSMIEQCTREAFNNFGERMRVAGYDHHSNTNRFTMGKRFQQLLQQHFVSMSLA